MSAVSQPPKPIPVLLLKTKSTPNDNYEEYFSRDGHFAPEFVPVLEHTFHAANLQKLRRLLINACCTNESRHEGACLRDGETRYGGLIFTSQRAVEAFAGVVREVGPWPWPLLPPQPDLLASYLRSVPAHRISLGSSTHSHSLITTASEPTTTLSQLSLPLYVVGPATSCALTALTDTSLPACSVLGAETGNGENLATFILHHYNSFPRPNLSEPKPTLLFLVGEQRRDIIPRTLSSPTLPPAQRIDVDEMVVYESGLLPSFAGDLAGVLERSVGVAEAEAEAEAEAGWVVVFSPTGCKELLGVLGDLGEGKGEEGEGTKRRRRIFVATIGPTTRDYLVREFGFEPDVCAESPSPDGVGEGMRRFMEGRGLVVG